MDRTTATLRLAEVVRAALEAQGVTQLDLSARTGIPQATLSRRLAGHVSFTVDELYRIADAIGVPAAEFVGAAA